MASPGNRHCANCIGTLLFPISVLFFSRPRSEGWPHHGRTFSIYPCRLSFWLTLPGRVLSTSWCCPSRPCVCLPRLRAPGIVPCCLLSFPIIKWNELSCRDATVKWEPPASGCRVDDRGLVKVADFGLSRELIVQDYYRLCHSKTPVPVRWMAPESLSANVFTTMSDVVRSASDCYFANAGKRSIAMSVFVCLSVREHRIPGTTPQSSPNFAPLTVSDKLFRHGPNDLNTSTGLVYSLMHCIASLQQ